MEEVYDDSEFEKSEEDFHGEKFSKEEKEMHDATCSKCGKKCKVPFKPEKDKPVYCKECYMEKKPRKSFGFQKRRNFNTNPREMHDAKCSKCGIECQVPFKPREGGSVLCKECYIKSKRP